jgi:hypothetical protein
MPLQQSRLNVAARTHRVANLPSISANDAVLRATGVLSLLAIGAIHFLQIVPTTESTPLLGVSFLLLIAACVAVAARLATRTDHRTWKASALVCAAAIGGYLFTRLLNTPLDNQDAGNWSCMLGLAALFVETNLLAISVYSAQNSRVLQSAVRTAQVGGEGARLVEETSSAA